MAGVLLNPQAATYGLYAAPPTGIASIDHPMLTALIAATPPGGVARIPAVGDTPYALSGPFVVNKSMSLIGDSASEVQASLTEGIVGSGEWPTKAPYLRGAVFLQTLAGADGIQVTGDGTTVNLHNLGVKFDTAIRFVNTGHAFHFQPASAFSGFFDHGQIGGQISNLRGWGVDGSHYCLRMVNPLQYLISHVRGFGGGHIEVVASSATYNYGNLIIQGTYGKMFVGGGTAHGYSFKANRNGALNLILMSRPQVNIGGKPGATFPEVTTSPTPANELIHIEDNVLYMSFHAEDFEANSIMSPVNWGGAFRRFQYHEPINRQNGMVPPATTIAPASSSGVGATASLGLNSTDRGGSIVVTTGASGVDGTAGNVMATVTFAQPGNNIGGFQISPGNGAAGLISPGMFTVVGANSVSLRFGGTTPPPGTVLVFSYSATQI